MQTSRFQLGLIATLAVGLGFSLSSSDAVGYPAGAAVSMGSNPVVSETGVVTSSSTGVFSAPDDQQLVITDVMVSAYKGADGLCNQASESRHVLIESSEKTLARYGVGHYHNLTYNWNYETGIVVPPGETVSIRYTGCSGSLYLNYSMSGYYAQP